MPRGRQRHRSNIHQRPAGGRRVYPSQADADLHFAGSDADSHADVHVYHAATYADADADVHHAGPDSDVHHAGADSGQAPRTCAGACQFQLRGNRLTIPAG